MYIAKYERVSSNWPWVAIKKTLFFLQRSKKMNRLSKTVNIQLTRKTKIDSIIIVDVESIESPPIRSVKIFCDEKNDCMTLSKMTGGIVEHHNDNGSTGNRQLWCIAFAGNYPICFIFLFSFIRRKKIVCRNNKAKIVSLWFSLKLFTKWANTFTLWTM